PTAIHVAAYLEVIEALLPALHHLHAALLDKSVAFDDALKTGRTHLMDAMPVRLGQEFGGYAAQIKAGIERVEASLPRLAELALGGTAVGTGINALPGFAAAVAVRLSEITGAPFREADNHFAAQASMDACVELSGQLKAVAVSLMKISNDLRWMNSGPIAGLGEIVLPALQPGSSIMPGKINPVIPEAMTMVCAQVFGNDQVVTIAGQSGTFELNVMLPVLARNLLESITLLANASRVLADLAIAGLVANRDKMLYLVDKNPILVTALNPVIGYDKAAQAAKKAYAEGRTVKEVVVELGFLDEAEATRLLDARPMTGD
ncbi:MAG: aspartate ammonia-lyase, partial [Anaerolineae bacterium]|nr:aspartate ammonia-lyase [Anaerolineae bacterium]